MKIINVVGARPNFMKIAPIMRALGTRKNIRQILVHTGQHYDVNMSKVFFKDLDIPKPDIHLGVKAAGRDEQIDRIKKKFEAVLKKETPEVVVVVGDVNSTLACALAAREKGVRIAHVEAGLRSFDMSMPEEINRIETDKVADILMTSCADADNNLLKEGIPSEKIFLVGNVMIDSLVFGMGRLNERPSRMEGRGKYAVVTIHRQSNVDDKKKLTAISDILRKVSRDIRLVFPVHPRTKKQIEMFGLGRYYERNIEMLPPLGYLDFIGLYKGAEFVITDSGGIQEETTFLNVPCLTMRENTERPITVSHGTNKLVGFDEKLILSSVGDILGGKRKRKKPIKLWDGKASERIAKIISQK